MTSKKKAFITLGLLAIGGVGAASMMAGGQQAVVTGKTPRPSRFGRILSGLPTGQGKKEAASVIQIPPQAEVRFPEPPDYTDFLSRFLAPKEPKSRYVTGKRREVIYGGYTPSSKTYVFGGKQFETQAAKEIVSQGYSPTLGAAFGISPEISTGTKKTVSEVTKTPLTGSQIYGKYWGKKDVSVTTRGVKPGTHGGLSSFTGTYASKGESA